jgi:Rrf2 family protein
MKLSTKSRYGLRILLQIALDNLNGKPLSQGRKIAEKQGITDAYLEQIMIPLKRGGIVGTIRGCNGGYDLRKKAEDITVLEIIELFEGRIKLADCNSGKQQCQRTDNCPTINVWTELEDAFREKAATITLESILEHYKKDMSIDYII